jgi:hypothetical protein
MDPEFSVPCLHESSIGPYSETDKFSARLPTLFP